jgi:hypothetical protein
MEKFGIINEDNGKMKYKPEMTKLPAEFELFAKNAKKEQISETLKSIGEWMATHFQKERSLSNTKFRVRTVEEIIKEKDVTGCSDMATVLMAVLRAGGTPAIWVETIHRDWLDGKLDQRLPKGHVYLKSLIQGKTEIIDPARVFESRGERWQGNPEQDQQIVMAEGMDSWSLGIRDSESMLKKAEAFREQWQKNEKQSDS